MGTVGGLYSHFLTLRGCHADTAGNQSGDRFGIDLDAGKKSRPHPDAAGIPEFGVFMYQPVVGRLDVYVDENILSGW